MSDARNDFAAVLEQARQAREMGDLTRAHTLYVRATELNLKDAAAWAGRAATSLDADEAMVSWGNALTLEPQDQQAQAMLALRVQERISQSGERDARALIALGRDLAKLGLVSFAYQLFVRATQLDYEDDDAWVWRGGSTDSASEAISCLNRALALNPENARAIAGLRWVLAQPSSDLAPSAESTAQAAKQVSEGQRLYTLGDKSRAHEFFVRATELDYRNESAWLWRGSSTSNVDEALLCMEQALVINPENHAALEARQWLQARKAQPRNQAQSYKLKAESEKRQAAAPQTMITEPISIEISAALTPNAEPPVYQLPAPAPQAPITQTPEPAPLASAPLPQPQTPQVPLSDTLAQTSEASASAQAPVAQTPEPAPEAPAPAPQAQTPQVPLSDTLAQTSEASASSQAPVAQTPAPAPLASATAPQAQTPQVPVPAALTPTSEVPAPTTLEPTPKAPVLEPQARTAQAKVPKAEPPTPQVQVPAAQTPMSEVPALTIQEPTLNAPVPEPQAPISTATTLAPQAPLSKAITTVPQAPTAQVSEPASQMPMPPAPTPTALSDALTPAQGAGTEAPSLTPQAPTSQAPAPVHKAQTLQAPVLTPPARVPLPPAPVPAPETPIQQAQASAPKRVPPQPFINPPVILPMDEHAPTSRSRVLMLAISIILLILLIVNYLMKIGYLP